MRQIACACAKFTSMLDKPLVPVLPPQQKLCCQPVKYCTYWPVIVSFNNWNIIKVAHKSTTSEASVDIHQVVIDGISNSVALPVQYGKYGTMKTMDSTTMGYCVIKFVPQAYTLQEETNVTGKLVQLVKWLAKIRI